MSRKGVYTIGGQLKGKQVNCGVLGFRVEGLGMFRERVYKGFSWFRPQPAPHFLFGFPKFEGTFLGVPVLRTRRIMVYWIYG